ncbi:hypothetical protein CPV28_20190 [Salmonella enterica]|nr:hypothetical protein [Salmonella enterica]
MVLPFNRLPVLNLNEQRESHVAGLSNIERVVNEFAVAAKEVWHTEHPFKYFLHKIFGVYEQEFMMFTTTGGKLELLVNSLVKFEALRRDLGLKALVGQNNNGMFRFNDGTVALFKISGEQGELMCGSELRFGGKEIWDSLQQRIAVRAKPEAMELEAMELELDFARDIMQTSGLFSDSGDEIMQGLNSAITFCYEMSMSNENHFKQCYLGELRDLQGVCRSGLSERETVDLSGLGYLTEVKSIVAAAAGRIVERAESGAYGNKRLDDLIGLNVGVCNDWEELARVGDAAICKSEYSDSALVMRRVSDNTVSVQALGVKGEHPRMYLNPEDPSQNPPGAWEIFHGDIELYRQRIRFQTASSQNAAVWHLLDWLNTEKVSDDKYLPEATECLNNLKKWIDSGRPLEAVPGIKLPEHIVSADDMARRDDRGVARSLARIAVFQRAVMKVIQDEISNVLPEMGPFIQRVKSMIETGKASWERLKNATDKKTTDHTINGMVCGWDRPCGVALRATTVDGGMVIYDDGQYCFCNSARPLTDKQALMIISHCNEHSLTPVLASIKLFGEHVNIGLFPEQRAEPSLVNRIIFKNGTPPEVRLEGGTVKETLARARTQGINVVADMYPPLGAPPLNTATLISMLHARQEQFHVVCALPDVDANGMANPELINLSIDFDLGNTRANCSFRVHVPATERLGFIYYLLSQEKFTPLLLQSILDGEQIFDSDSYSQGKTLAELCYSEPKDILIAAIAPKDESSTQITMISAGDPINFEVAVRHSSRGEHRGKLLINSLQKAGEAATRLSASALFSVTDAVDEGEFPNEKLKLLQMAADAMSAEGETSPEMLIRYDNTRKDIQKLKKSGAELTQEDIYVNLTPGKLRTQLIEGINHSYRRNWLYR